MCGLKINQSFIIIIIVQEWVISNSNSRQRFWETLSVYADEVQRVTIRRTLQAQSLTLVLSRPLLQFISSPKRSAKLVSFEQIICLELYLSIYCIVNIIECERYLLLLFYIRPVLQFIASPKRSAKLVSFDQIICLELTFLNRIQFYPITA